MITQKKWCHCCEQKTPHIALTAVGTTFYLCTLHPEIVRYKEQQPAISAGK